MRYLREVHFIVARMIDAAKRRDKDEVQRLNRDYSKLALRYHQPRLRVEGLYDRCVNNCGLAFGMLSNQLERLISKAEEIFSHIPEPKEEN